MTVAPGSARAAGVFDVADNAAVEYLRPDRRIAQVSASRANAATTTFLDRRVTNPSLKHGRAGGAPDM